MARSELETKTLVNNHDTATMSPDFSQLLIEATSMQITLL